MKRLLAILLFPTLMWGQVASVNGVDWADIASINGVAKADIASLNGVDAPAAGGGGDFATVTVGSPDKGTQFDNAVFALDKQVLFHAMGHENAAAEPTSGTWNTSENLVEIADYTNVQSGNDQWVGLWGLSGATNTTAMIDMSGWSGTVTGHISFGVSGIAGHTPSVTATNGLASNTSITVALTPDVAAGIIIIVLGGGDQHDAGISSGGATKLDEQDQSSSTLSVFYLITSDTSEKSFTLTLSSGLRPTVWAGFFPAATI